MFHRKAMRRLTVTALESRDLTILRIVLGIGASIRGWDLLWPDPTSTLFRIVNGPVPDWAWGAAFLGSGATLILATLRRCHFFVWLGHGGLATTYSALMVYLSIYWVRHGVDFHAYLRYLGVFLPLMAIHAILWARTGATPEDDDAEHHS